MYQEMAEELQNSGRWIEYFFRATSTGGGRVGRRKTKSTNDQPIARCSLNTTRRERRIRRCLHEAPQGPPISVRIGFFHTTLVPHHHFHQPRSPTMTPKPQGPELEDHIISSLDVAIDALNITKEILSITPAKAVCGSVGVVLTMIRV